MAAAARNQVLRNGGENACTLSTRRMTQYIDSRTAYVGEVRKVVLLHLFPSDRPDEVLASIDVLEHVVRHRGLCRARLAPRTTRKVPFEPMTEPAARALAEAIAREHGTPYVCVVSDVVPIAVPVAPVALAAE